MRYTVICKKTLQYPCNFMYKASIVEATTFPKMKLPTLLILQKSNISRKYNYTMSLQTIECRYTIIPQEKLSL